MVHLTLLNLFPQIRQLNVDIPSWEDKVAAAEKPYLELKDQWTAHEDQNRQSQ